MEIPFLYWEDEYYNKAKNQTKMQLYGTMDFLKVDDKLPVRYIYGLGVFVDGAVEEQLEI